MFVLLSKGEHQKMVKGNCHRLKEGIRCELEKGGAGAKLKDMPSCQQHGQLGTQGKTAQAGSNSDDAKQRAERRIEANSVH